MLIALGLASVLSANIQPPNHRRRRGNDGQCYAQGVKYLPVPVGYRVGGRNCSGRRGYSTAAGRFHRRCQADHPSVDVVVASARIDRCDTPRRRAARWRPLPRGAWRFGSHPGRTVPAVPLGVSPGFLTGRRRGNVTAVPKDESAVGGEIN